MLASSLRERLGGYSRFLLRRIDRIHAVCRFLIESILVRRDCHIAERRDSAGKILVIGLTRIWPGVLNYSRYMIDRGWCYNLVREGSNYSIDLPTGEHWRIERPKTLAQTVSVVGRQCREGKVSLVEVYHHGDWFVLHLLVRLLKAAQIPYVTVYTGRELLNWDSHRRYERIIIREIASGSSALFYKEPYMVSRMAEANLGYENRRHEFRNGLSPMRPNISPDYTSRCIVFLNSFKSFRRIPFLISEFEGVVRAIPDARLHLVGYRNRSELSLAEEAVGRHGLQDSVSISPFSPDGILALNRASLFVLPADHVYLNNSVLEAMASGIPVLLNRDAPWVERIVPSEDVGFLAAVDDGAWAARIAELLVDPSRLETVGRGGQEFVRKEFTLESIVDDLEAVYKRILG